MPYVLSENALAASCAAAPIAIAPPATRPDEGHGTARVLAGVGRRAGRDFMEVRVRATYHDLMDPDEGYSRGAQMEFFSLGVRQLDSGTTRIEEFTPIQILSLAPRDNFFQPWSWRVSAGWRREFLADGAEPLVGALDFGGDIGGAAAGGAEFQGRLVDYGAAPAALDSRLVQRSSFSTSNFSISPFRF